MRIGIGLTTDSVIVLSSVRRIVSILLKLEDVEAIEIADEPILDIDLPTS